MNRKATCAVLTQTALFATLLASSAAATTLDLETGTTLALAPGTSGSFILSLANVDAGDVESDFLAWVLGVQVLPTGGTTGTVTIGALTAASFDAIFAGVEEIQQPDVLTLADGATLNGTTAFFGMSMLGTEPATVVSGLSYNLGAIGLSASADALGTWQVFAVQQAAPNLQSYWFDGSAAEVDFGNLSSTRGTSALLLGTVSVVPEPATAAMVGLGGLSLALRHAMVRRRRRAAARGPALRA